MLVVTLISFSSAWPARWKKMHRFAQGLGQHRHAFWLCVSDGHYSYSYSIWHGRAIQPTREPEAHGVHPRLQQLMAVQTALSCCMPNCSEARIAASAKPAVPSDVLELENWGQKCHICWVCCVAGAVKVLQDVSRLAQAAHRQHSSSQWGGSGRRHGPGSSSRHTAGSKQRTARV